MGHGPPSEFLQQPGLLGGGKASRPARGEADIKHNHRATPEEGAPPAHDRAGRAA